MAHNVHLVVFPAQDLDKNKAFFSTFLGTEPYVDGSYYVGYKLGDLEIGLDPHGTAVISYIDVEDIQSTLKTLQEAGATVVMDSKDVGGGLLVAQVTFEGKTLGLRQK